MPSTSRAPDATDAKDEKQEMTGLEQSQDEDDLREAQKNLEEIRQTLKPFTDREGSFEAESPEKEWKNVTYE